MATEDEASTLLQLHRGQATEAAEGARAFSLARRFGRTIPIGVGRYNAQGWVTPHVPVAHEGGSGFKRLELDTGSDVLAFCPDADNHKAHTDLVICAAYMGSAWWGYAYSDDVSIQTDDHGGVLQVENATYAIMEMEHEMCGGDMEGIFGIAMKGGDIVGKWEKDKPVPTNTTPYSEWCKNGQAVVSETPVLISVLNEHSTPKQIGIYWTGEMGDFQGALFLDDEVRSNIHYQPKPEAPMKARLGTQGESYAINIVSITFGNTTHEAAGTPYDCSDLKSEGCILDTGTAGLFLPEGFSGLFSWAEAHRKLDTPVLIEIEGAKNSPNVVLRFTVGQLNGMHPWGDAMMTAQDAKAGGVILGWVVWAFYYIIFDITDGSVEFVPKPTCEVGEHVQCPGAAGVMCAGAQCCPRAPFSGNSTFACPSAPVGTQGCEARQKEVNCVMPTIAPISG